MLGYGYGYNKILPRLDGSSFDPDALEFIANWEIKATASLGVPTTMDLMRRIAVNDFYRGLKGEGTPNGSDLHSIAVANGTKMFILIPISDSVANGDVYCLDAISNGNIEGLYANMVAGDFTPQGVIGGTGKWFRPFVNLDADYVTDYGFGIYSRTDLIKTTIDAGQNGANYIFTQLLDNRSRCRIGSISDYNILSPNGTGLIGLHTSNFQRKGFNNTSFSSFQSYTKGTFTSGELLFHAYNFDSPSLFSSRSLSFYYAGLNYINQPQLEDFYTVVQRLQSNVITGGRQIGTAIPPI